MIFVKQSTAVDVVIGPFVDDTDGKTAETALTISQADCQLMKNGGAAAQKNDATSATHLVNGHYKVPLNTTDTNTLGVMKLSIHETGALPYAIDMMVMPANVWDSLFGADYLQIDAAQWLGQTIAAVDTNGYPKVTVKSGTGTGEISLTSGIASVNTIQISSDSVAADNAEAFFDGTGYAGTNNVIPTVTTATNVTTVNGLAANVVTAASLAADAGAEIADAVWDESRAGHVTSGTFGEGVASVQGDVTGNVVGSVGSVTGAVGSVTGAVGSVTGNVGGNVVGSVGSVTGAVGSVTGAVGSVTGNVGGNVVGSVASVTGAVGSVTGSVGSVVAGVTVSSISANVVTASALATDAVSEITAALLASGDVDGYSVEDCLKVILAMAAGKLTTGVSSAVFRAADDSKDRITATVDADGNRTAVTLDATG